MLPSVRRKSILFFIQNGSGRNDNTGKTFHVYRNAEALCHSLSADEFEYQDRVLRTAFNMSHMTQPLSSEIPLLSDVQLGKGTLIQKIEQERNARLVRFQKMLDDKYEEMNDGNFHAIVRCRRCGSEDVTWEEKQTRSADEGATLFCSCTVCKNRWVLR
jgi:DNA-directed RNA polymerase subunit M/transcription elongation factor TFIIS